MGSGWSDRACRLLDRGLIAYEVARQAVNDGQRVDWLGVIDMLAPPMGQLQRAQLTMRWRLRRLREQPARERWAKLAEAAWGVVRSGRRALLRQGDLDYRGASRGKGIDWLARLLNPLCSRASAKRR